MYIDKIIHLDDFRIFIDIAQKGCGNGCKYCYIETAECQQILWKKEKISKALDQLEVLKTFTDEPERFMVSLCPSTEPLKSLEARELITYIIKRLAHYRCFFQIATKDTVTKEFLEEINDELLFEGQLIINISINNFSMASQIEPNALTPDDRLANIDVIRGFQKIKSCILIKPFLALTYKDKEIFKKKIINHIPDHICVGIYFFNNHSMSEQDSEMYYNEHFGKQDTKKIYEFMDELHNVMRVRIFPSSLCVFNQYRRGFVLPNASRTELCSGCGQCKE